MVEDLVAEVKAARAADDAARLHTERVKELLIRLRLERPKMTLPEIEDLIGRFYDRATISRYTAPALGTTRPRKAAAES